MDANCILELREVLNVVEDMFMLLLFSDSIGFEAHFTLNLQFESLSTLHCTFESSKSVVVIKKGTRMVRVMRFFIYNANMQFAKASLCHRVCPCLCLCVRRNGFMSWHALLPIIN